MSMTPPRPPFRPLALAIVLCSLFAIQNRAFGTDHSATELTEKPLENLLNTEVISASRLARQISDTPSAVSIVTSEDIRTYGYRTLAEVIASMRGLFTTYDRKYEYMGGRIFGKPDDFAGRVMLMIDGYATQDNVFNQAFIDNSALIDIDLVQQVEYIPGTGSVSHGNNALLGIINIVTKKGVDLQGTEIAYRIGQRGMQEQRVSVGKQLDNGGDFLLSYTHHETDGAQSLYFPEYRSTPSGGLALNRDGEHGEKLFAKWQHGGFRVQAAHSERFKQVPTAPRGNTAIGAPYESRDFNSYIQARYDTDLSLQLKSSSRAYFAEYANQDFFEYAVTYSDGTKYRQNDSKGRWFGFDQKLIGNWFTNHLLLLGLETRRDAQQDYVKGYLTQNFQPLPSIGHRMSRWTNSLYLEDAITLNTEWQTVIGIRHDRSSDDYAHTSPRLAAIYKPSHKTTWKASYSSAFRMPNAFDLHDSGGVFQSKPEHVRAYELLAQHQITPDTQWTTSLYEYRLDNVIYFNPTLNRTVNDGEAKSHGLETELIHQWPDGKRLKSSLSWQNARDADHRPMANSPRLMAKFNYSQPLHAIRVGIEAQHFGPRYTLYSHRELASTNLIHLTFSSLQPWQGISATLAVKNLQNKRYEVPAALGDDPNGQRRETLIMDGRSLWMQFNYRF